MENIIYYYTYNCPICGGMCEVGFYDMPYEGDTFTCDANGKPHDLLINNVDNVNMTIEVEDLYSVLRKDFEDYYKKRHGHKLPDDFSIGYVEC